MPILLVPISLMPILLVPINQIKQREQVNPNDVDEMPVKATDFERRVIFRREASLPRHPQEPAENTEPDNHVQRMQAGHDEVEGEENFSVPRIRVLTGVSGNGFLIKAEDRKSVV